jgi:hypothetical protein
MDAETVAPSLPMSEQAHLRIEGNPEANGNQW